MDEFKMKSTHSTKYDCDPDSSLKRFGRKSARRSSKQINWMEDFIDMNCPMDWNWDEIWDGDYDYWDDLDIYEETLDWCIDNKDSLGFTYGSGD